ncbi:hypothetical protein EGR_09425 [Echinococcus granulosus]|uniref:Uncharacterized protein n=1 Tax=Echinococcus granulosus TaxID=6210 RepID=W6UB81_ECHGR|nr:hypothetical protein EGR_09425 [Echinococcus granulosus]EUB55712.1 hypothetical protein EGR_09425 [Echinococcus granulosus]
MDCRNIQTTDFACITACLFSLLSTASFLPMSFFSPPAIDVVLGACQGREKEEEGKKEDLTLSNFLTEF